MRDPAVNTTVAAVLEETRMVLGLLARLGALRTGREDEPDYEIRSKARVQLTLYVARADERGLSDDVRHYLYSLVNDTEIDSATGAVRRVRRRSRPTQTGRRKNTVRDQFIVDMIARIAWHGIFPTRNRDPSPDKPRSRSGCDMVAQVLKEFRELGLDVSSLSERRIERIWERNRHDAQPHRLTFVPNLTPVRDN